MGKIKEILHIEKHEAVCDLCGSLIALTKRELGAMRLLWMGRLFR